jgi:hypothetical protein
MRAAGPLGGTIALESSFMSGYSPDLLQNKGILETGEEVPIKPIQPLDLVRKVRAVLDLPPGGDNDSSIMGL